MKKPQAQTKARISGWRLAVWLLLAAFTLQAYVAQTHIHDTAPAVISKLVASDDGNAPANKSQPDCPFCQAVAQAGAFHLPGSPLLILAEAFVFMAAPSHPAPAAYDTTAHNWRSRAPPQN